MRRTTGWTAGAVMAALTLASCATGTGGGDQSDEGEAAEYGDGAELSGELTIMGFGLDDEIGQVRYDRAVEAVEGVDVQLSEGGLDMQQFLSAVAAGEAPGIIRANRDQIGTLASRGAILPLADCIEGEQIDTGQFVDAAISQVTFNDVVHGIPEFNTVQLTMANSELLEQNGLDLQDVNGSSWEALTSANEALSERSGGSIEVIGYDSKLPEFLPLWAQANGVMILSEDGRTAHLDDPAVVEALDFAVGIYEAQGGFGGVKAFRDSADFFGENNQFAEGSLGAMGMEQWYVNVLNEMSPDAPVIFDTVRDRSGETLAYASGSAWAIPSGSDNPAAACRFARVMTEVDSWMAAAQERVELREQDGLQFTGLLTGNQVADDRIRDELVTPSGEENWDQAVTALYDANDNAFSLAANPADAEFRQSWLDAVNRVLNGQQGVREALTEAQTEAQAALDTAWEAWDSEQGQ